MESGYKTRQRELILQFLVQHAQRHLSAEEVVGYLREQNSPVGKSTVYRYLDRLVAQGRVRKYFLQEGMGACYQYAEDSAACQEHFHLKCTACTRLLHVECKELSGMAEHLMHHHRFCIDQTKTVLYGTCADCAVRLQSEGDQPWENQP